MNEERTNAYPADRKNGLSPIVQSPLQGYLEGEGQQDPPARSGDLLLFEATYQPHRTDALERKVDNSDTQDDCQTKEV